MRVLFLTTSRSWGGMEIYPVRLAAALAAAGHEVRVARRPGTEIDRACAALGIPAIGLNAREVRSFRADVLDVHHPRDLGRAVGLLARLRRRERPCAIFTKHTASPPGTRKRDLYHRWIVRSLDGFITASRFVADGLAEAYGVERERVHVVPYGYDPSSRGGVTSRAELAADLGIPGDRPVIGCVAQLSRGKQQHTLLEALGLLANRGRQAHAVLVGGEADPGYRVELGALARQVGVGDRVTFLGERRDVERLLGLFDLFALPSRAESFGIVILEAWAAAVPVVATYAGGVPEFVEEGVSGLLVPPGEANALAAAIERVLGDRALAATLSLGGQRSWMTRHRMEHAVARTVAAYETIAAGYAPGRRGGWAPADVDGELTL